MRKLLSIIGAAVMLAACAMGQSRYVPFEVSLGTNAAEIVTASQPISGYIDAVMIENASKAAVTSAVTFTISPNIGTNLVSEVIYTNATQSASVVARPRVTPTDTSGNALTSLTVREPYLCTGDTVTFRVNQSTSVTGVTFKAWLRIK